ncbi:MAG: hypothetical protein M4D80_06895 [Myxococcota bacterium]|nr:hypothetical protein [Deltaproteobacteria bacterium]MDQ3334868.1 hypothetical protein [Myxococcota bacterium]
MRSTNFVLTVGLVLTGACAAGAGSTRGVTHREHIGSVQVIFTNATPDKMCELHMTFDEQRDMGDNWLPEGGLASGKSAEFKVKPGKYQATWSTCKDGDKPYYAGTLIGDTSINVGQQTQLFTYVADTVAPTKRAPVLGRDYQVVRFAGQPVGPIAKSDPVAQRDAFAAFEKELGRGVAPAKTEPVQFEKFSAKDMIDPKAKATAAKAKGTKAKTNGKRAAVRPSLDRKHDIGSNGKYAIKQ